MKICTKCKIEYPATVEYFPPRRKAKDRLSSWCRICQRKATQIYSKTFAGIVSRKRAINKYNKKPMAKFMKKAARVKHINTVRGYLGYRYNAIRQRCHNPRNINYKNYGAKGVKLKFTLNEFINHVRKLKISIYGLQIHRIKKHYELNNIEFLTRGKHRQKHKKGD